MITLKYLLSEAKRPPYRFIDLPKKNPAIKIIDQIKSCRSSIISLYEKGECISACYKLSSVCKGYSVKIYFAVDPKEFDKKDDRKSPFSYGEQIIENSAYYNEKPHIVFNLTNYFFVHLKNKDYQKLFDFFNSTLNHELIHVNQNKEFSDEITKYFSEFRMTKFTELHESGELRNIFKALGKNYKSVNKGHREIVANQYLLNPVEFPAYAYSCIAELAASLNSDIENDIPEMKNKISDIVDTGKCLNKSRTFKLFSTFIQSEYPSKYREWIKLVKQYLYTLNDSYFQRYK